MNEKMEEKIFNLIVDFLEKLPEQLCEDEKSYDEECAEEFRRIVQWAHGDPFVPFDIKHDHLPPCPKHHEESLLRDLWVYHLTKMYFKEHGFDDE